MAIYRKVQVDFWDDTQMLDLTPEDKLFYMYLLTNPHTSQCGIYELPYQKMVLHLGYTRETCVKLIDRFKHYGKIHYNETTKEIMLVNWIKHNWNNSPKVIKYIEKELADVKFRPFVDAFISICADRGYKLYANSTDTVSIQYPSCIDTVPVEYPDSEKPVDFVDNPPGYSIDTVSVPYRQEEEKEEEKEEEELKDTTTTHEAAVLIWNSCKSHIEKKISKPSFETWLKGTNPISYENGILIIEAPSEFAREWLESRYAVLIKETLLSLSKGKDVCVKFVLPEVQQTA